MRTKYTVDSSHLPSKKVPPRVAVFIGIALGVTMTLSHVAFAASVTYDGYPPPGGVTATGSGAGAVAPLGETWNYSAFTPSAYGSLYYVIDLATYGVSLSGGSTTDMLSFDAAASNLAGGVLAFNGQTTIPISGGGPQTAYTMFVMTVTDSSHAPLALTSAGSIPGLPSADGAALNISPTLASAGFNANWQFEMSSTATGGYEAASTYYDAVGFKDPSFELQSSVNGGFYSTAPVPLPAAAWLLLSGLGALGAFGRRKAAATQTD